MGFSVEQPDKDRLKGDIQGTSLEQVTGIAACDIIDSNTEIVFSRFTEMAKAMHLNPDAVGEFTAGFTAGLAYGMELIATGQLNMQLVKIEKPKHGEESNGNT